MAERILIDKLEFYITNVCNLTCSGCNRYNNYKFAGWQRWSDYKDILQKWSEKINVRHPVILGGEPLLNPDIAEWFNGINELWPDLSGVQIQTNGTRIDRVKGLYEICANRKGNWIGVSLHSPDDCEEIFQRIRNFLVPPITMTQDPTNRMGSKWQFKDSNNVVVHAWLNDHFVQSNIIDLPDGKKTLYNSDPDKAHEICTFRQFKNYHMIRGKIYKCGPVALMPEFDQQFNLELSPEDRILMNSYRPLGVDEFDERGKEFFDTIDNVIPQCKFCPEVYKYEPITFTDLKKPWKKVINIESTD